MRVCGRARPVWAAAEGVAGRPDERWDPIARAAISPATVCRSVGRPGNTAAAVSRAVANAVRSDP